MLFVTGVKEKVQPCPTAMRESTISAEGNGEERQGYPLETEDFSQRWGGGIQNLPHGPDHQCRGKKKGGIRECLDFVTSSFPAAQGENPGSFLILVEKKEKNRTEEKRLTEKKPKTPN